MNATLYSYKQWKTQTLSLDSGQVPHSKTTLEPVGALPKVIGRGSCGQQNNSQLELGLSREEPRKDQSIKDVS